MAGYRNLSQDTPSIAVRFFEHDAVVYGVVSGETHLMGIPAARLLEAVVAGCSDAEELERIFAGNGPGTSELIAENSPKAVRHIQ